MDSNPRGCCLIINNQFFHNMGERVGTGVNRDDLDNLWTSFGFRVIIKNNLTGQVSYTAT